MTNSYLTLYASGTPQLLLAGKPLVPNLGAVGYTIANNDITNPVWIGENKSVTPNSPGAVQVAPLGSAPIDPTTSTYIVTSGPTVQIFLFAGGGTWAPSPAQVAAQINALGLATAANQASQIGVASSINTVLGTGIAIPIGAATDATSQGINNAAQGINANHAALDSMGVNPYFTDPNGNASTAGWIVSSGSLVAAGKNGSVALPAGSGFVNGAQVTPNNTSNHVVIEPGGNGAPIFAVLPFQNVISHFLLNMASLANSPSGLCEYSWYTSTGTFISNTLVTSALVPLSAGKWLKIYGTAVAPSTAAWCQASGGISEAGNIPATDIFTITAFIAHALGSPGSRAADHAQHIANTGVPLLVNRNFIYNQSFTVPGTGGTTTLAQIPISQIGYDGDLILTAAGTNVTTALVPCQIGVTWFEGATVVDAQVYEVYAGTTGVPHDLYIKGPTRGTSVQISFGNNNSGITINGNIQLYNTGRLYLYDLWRTNTGLFTSGTGAGLANAAYGTNYGLIGQNSVAALAAGATSSFVLPLFTGKVVVEGSTNSGAADLQIFGTDVIGPFGGTTFNAFTNSQGILLVTDYTLYNTQQTVGLRNTNGAAKNVGFNIIASDY